MEVQWRCGLGGWAAFSPLARSGAGAGRQQKSREAGPVHCCRRVGRYALPATVGNIRLGHCCCLLEAVWKSAGSVARLSRATLSAWCLSQVPSGLGAPPLAAVTAVSLHSRGRKKQAIWYSELIPY